MIQVALPIDACPTRDAARAWFAVHRPSGRPMRRLAAATREAAYDEAERWFRLSKRGAVYQGQLVRDLTRFDTRWAVERLPSDTGLPDARFVAALLQLGTLTEVMAYRRRPGRAHLIPAPAWLRDGQV